MSPTKKILSLAACVAALFIAGCGSSEVTFEKGEPGQTATTGNYSLNNAPHIVHVDTVERMATLRNGSSLKEGFLIALDSGGKQTSVLKTIPMRSASSLRTADVLEGKPQINNAVRPANTSETRELEKIYREAK